jgi:hypothetical protein
MAWPGRTGRQVIGQFIKNILQKRIEEEETLPVQGGLAGTHQTPLPPPGKCPGQAVLRIPAETAEKEFPGGTFDIAEAHEAALPHQGQGIRMFGVGGGRDGAGPIQIGPEVGPYRIPETGPGPVID